MDDEDETQESPYDQIWQNLELSPEKVEERSLEAQGVNLVTARRKAQRAAEALVATAAELRSAAASAAARIRPYPPNASSPLRPRSPSSCGRSGVRSGTC